MAKKKGPSDEIDINDDLDYSFGIDIPDFDDPHLDSKSRTPVEKLTKGFSTGLKGSLSNAGNIKQSLAKALPRGYGQAFTVYDQVADTASELYHSVAKDLKPLTENLRIAAKKLSPSIKAKLPKGLAAKLDAFSEGGNSYGEFNAAKFKRDNEDSIIASTLAELFHSQEERQVEQFVDSKAEGSVKSAIEGKRYKDTFAQGDVIAQGISRLVGYQDQVLARYQRKSLELQYRQYFVAKDLLDITNVQQQKIVAALGIVVSNTALPEAVKIRRSEMVSHMLHQRMSNGLISGVADYTRNFRDGLKKNVKGLVKGFSSTIGGGAAAVGSGEDVDAATAGSNAAGERFGSELHNRISTAAAPHMERIKPLTQLGAKVGNFIDSGPAKLNRWAQSETEGIGWKADLTNILKAIPPQFRLNDSIESSNVLDSDKPANFDNLTRRSIVDIIPGWLQQINRWTKATATGKIDSDKDMDVYNLEQGRFTTSTDYLKDIKRRVSNGRTNKSASDSLDEFVNGLDTDSKLDEAGRKALKKKIIGDASKGRGFDEKTISERKYYDGLDEDQIDVVRDFLKDAFGVDFEGNMDQDQASLDRYNKHLKQFTGIESTLPSTGANARNLHQVYGPANMDRLGLTSRENHKDKVNYDGIWNELATGNEADDKGLDNYGGKAAGGRGGRGGRGGGGQFDVSELTGLSREQLNIQKEMFKFLSTTFTDKKDSPRPAERAEIRVTDECNPCASHAEYFGEDSPLLTLLRGIQGDTRANNISELIDRQNAILNEQTDIIDDIDIRISQMGAGGPQGAGGGDAGEAGNTDRSKKKGGLAGRIVKGAAGLGWKGVKGYAKLSWEGYKLAGKGAWWTAKKGGGILGSVGGAFGRKAFEKAKAKGVYVKGAEKDAKPNLTQEGIDSGEYLDVKSGKPIKSMKDITGEVVDKENKTVLTEDQFNEGIVNEKGTTLRGQIFGAVGGTARFAAGAAWAPYKYGYKAIKAVFNVVNDQMDLYLKGESIARLKKNLMKEGKYFDAITRMPILKVSDIKGAVIDENGDEVVSVEEIAKSKGFWTVTGKAVKGVATTAIKLAVGAAKLYGKALMLPFKAAAWIGKKVFKGLGMFKGKGKDKTGGAGNFDDGDLVTIGWHQLRIQDEMFKFLKKRFDKKKAVAGDADGDGDRDGSWRDILANRKAKKDAADAKKAAAAGVGAAGVAGKPGAKEGEEGVSATDAGIAGVAGAAAWGAVKSGVSSAASWVGKKVGVQALKTGAMNAARFVGRQVLWRGAQIAGTALISVLGAPVVLGALAVGAVGYGSYKLYKHIANKPEPLVGLRYAQYGINPREAEQIAPIAQLEEMFIKNTSYNDEGKAIVGKGTITPEAILKLFNLDPNAEDDDTQKRIQLLTQWIAIRFMPVYVAHATFLNKLSKGTLLTSIDKELPIQQWLDFIKGVRLTEMVKVFDDTDVSPFEDEMDSDADVVTKWADDAVNIANVKLSGLPDEPDKKLNDTAKTAAAVAVVAGAGGGAGAVDKASGDKTNGAAALESKGAMMGLVGGVVALGAVIAAPTTIVANFASMGIKSLISGEKKRPKVTLDALTAGRYKVYGLVELDIEKVEAIYNLEDAMYNDVTYDSNNQAVYGGTAEKIYPLAKTYFGVTADIGTIEERSTWFAWYRYRFLPTFIQFCSSVRSKQPIDARDASKKLTLDEQHQVLVETSSATSTYGGTEVSVWLVDVSPWDGYKLNSEDSSIAGNIEALKTAGKRAGWKESSRAVVDPKTEIEMAKRQEAIEGSGDSVAPGSDGGDNRSIFAMGMDKVFGGKGPDGGRSGGWFGKEGSSEKVFDANAKNLGGGAVIQKHPGGGTGGDINSIPAPNGDGWAAAKDTLVAAANMVGFDAATAATVAAVESGFRPGVKAPTSSAGGYFQFIDSTWEATLKKHGAKYGLSADASKYDGRANALMGMEFLKENQEYLEQTVTDRPVSDTDLYAAHFLGPAGARRFLKAAPGSDARQAVGEKVPGANHNIFYDKGNSARTVSGVYGKFNEMLVSKRKMHDLVVGQKSEVAAIDEAGNLTGNAAGAEVAGQPVSTDGTVSTAGAGTVGIMAMGAGSTEPAAAGPVGIMPMATGAAPAAAGPVGVMAMGGQGKSVMEASAPTTPVQGTQSTSAGSLTTPTSMGETETTMAPAVQAAIAQTQSSAESGAINDSVLSVKGLMGEQLKVQMSMDGKLSMIAELLKVSHEGNMVNDGKKTASVVSPPSTKSSTNGNQSSKLPNAPVNVSRNNAA
jgi:hypothetical protein